MESVPFTQAKAQLSEMVDRVERQHQRLAVTRHGRTAAILINEDDRASLEETVEILRDRHLLETLRSSRQQAAARQVSPLERQRQTSTEGAPPVIDRERAADEITGMCGAGDVELTTDEILALARE